MPRILIKIPEGKPISTVTIPVRITDINYGGHLGNDAMVSIVHEARMKFFAKVGFTEMEAGGTSLIMSSLAVNYKNESFYGDVLSIDIFVEDLSKISFDLIYNISSVRNKKNLLIAVAQTNMVCYNYDLNKINVMPQALREKLIH